AALLGNRLGLRLAVRSDPGKTLSLVCPDRPGRFHRCLLRRHRAAGPNGLRAAQPVADGASALVCSRNSLRFNHPHRHPGVRMILLWLILTLLIGGVVAWLGERRNDAWPRWISLVVLAVDLVLLLTLCAEHYGAVAVTAQGPWLADIDWLWIPPLGISFHLGMDGLSLLLILLTIGLGIMSVAASWTEITERVGFFHFNLLWTLAGVVGVFVALDLFLFFLFWELMLVPMYFLIAIWGHERRVYAAIKFFLFTQGSGLLMFAAILTLAFINYHQTGVLTFDYFALAKTQLGPTMQMGLMLGFFIAFA